MLQHEGQAFADSFIAYLHINYRSYRALTMPLVSYSDSEDSDAEAKIAFQPIARSISTISKPAFQKVVDRSNPHKITVHLPETSKGPNGRHDNEQEPPSKRARVGAGSFGDFNSLLPAPKRTTPIIALDGSSSRGVGLKTGSAPGFSRDISVATDAGVSTKEDLRVDDADSSVGVQGPKPLYEEDTETQKEPKPNSAKKGGPAIFKPLSVARKPKKRKADRAEDAAIARSMGAFSSEKVATVKKASLFSIDSETGLRDDRHGLEGEYRPMIYESAQSPGGSGKPSEDSHVGHKAPETLEKLVDGTEHPIGTPATLPSSQGASQSLDAIAADLHLSASAKRQLFGRNKNKASEISIVNFDTDQEYAANELLRQAGEQALHNPVRSIAPGKHSLKQLVNAASHQKDALEEHFASGKRNKKEAGSKYGW